jgi:hypothetical protein
MVEMTQPRSTSPLGVEFNAFLFASLNEGAAAAPLSVVSALARLDLDPWQEAAELTRLPRETATQRLSALLTKLPGGPPALADSRTIALRLIALLPGPAGPAIGSSRSSAGLGASAYVDPTVVMILYMLMSVIAMATLGLTDHPSPAPSSVTAAPASGAALSKGSAAKVHP